VFANLFNRKSSYLDVDFIGIDRKFFGIGLADFVGFHAVLSLHCSPSA
jgi:hypothetical protein